MTEIGRNKKFKVKMTKHGHNRLCVIWMQKLKNFFLTFADNNPVKKIFYNRNKFLYNLEQPNLSKDYLFNFLVSCLKHYIFKVKKF